MSGQRKVSKNFARPADKPVTAKKLIAAILRILDDAGMPVWGRFMPVAVARELGREVSPQVIKDALDALHRDRRIMKCGVIRGSQRYALA